MLTSISPLGERARGNRFLATAAAYLAGSLLGGVAIGALLGALGDLSGADRLGSRVVLLVLAAVAVAGLALDILDRLPTVRRQVDERWLADYRGWVYGAGFGFQLGLGVVTIVTASTTYVALAGAALTGTVAGGALVGGVFGLARALPIALVARVHEPEALGRFHRRVAEAAGTADRATRLAQATAAAAAVVLAVVATGAAA